MRNLTTTLCLTFAVLLASPVRAETVLYCLSELVTGFYKEGSNWRLGNFKKERVTMRFEDDFARVQIKMKGQKNIRYSCFNSGEWHGYYPIVCKADLPSNSTTLNIDKKSLRFVLTKISVGGYASIPREGEFDGDAIYAGKCARF